MFESISPEQYAHYESSGEEPSIKTGPEKVAPVPSDRDEADEEINLAQIEAYAERFPQELSFLDLERTLDLALSQNAPEAYRKAGYVLKGDAELPFFRLTDLDTALTLLERFKKQLPNRYQANIMKVIEHSNTIKQIFHEYRSLREQGQGHDTADVAALVSALDALRKIDPEVFPADLVDVTDEEYQRATWQPATRKSEPPPQEIQR